MDNHDVERIASKLNNKEHLKLVTMLLYTIYGIPSVYYGSEFGIEGRKERGSDWNLRPCLELEQMQKKGLPELCTQLGALKKEYKELSEGQYQELLLTNRQFAFGRVLSDSAVVTALNNDDNEAVLEINAPVGAAYAVDLLQGAKQVEYQNGHLRVTLAANSGTILLLTNKEGKRQGTEKGCLAEGKEDAAVDSPEEKPAPCESMPEAKQQASAGTSWQPKLEGFGIMVKDMKTMVNFYHDVLGFDVEYQEGMRHVSLKKDGVLFMMYGWNDFESMTSQKYQHIEGLIGHYEIALAVENFAAVDAAFHETVGKGAKPILPPSLMEWGQKTCYIADPEGNMIEIGSFNE